MQNIQQQTEDSEKPFHHYKRQSNQFDYIFYETYLQSAAEFRTQNMEVILKKKNRATWCLNTRYNFQYNLTIPWFTLTFYKNETGKRVLLEFCLLRKWNHLNSLVISLELCIWKTKNGRFGFVPLVCFNVMLRLFNILWIWFYWAISCAPVPIHTQHRMYSGRLKQ